MNIEQDGIAPGALRVTVHETPEAHIIALDGELDVATVEHLNAAVAMAMRERPAALVIDLRKLTFFGAAGMTTLLDAYEQCRALGCRLVLIRGSRCIQRIFAICEVEGFFEFMHRPEEVAPSLRSSLAQQAHSSTARDVRSRFAAKPQAGETRRQHGHG